MFQNLVTAKQAVHIYGFAGVTKDKLPRKHQTATFQSPLDPAITFSIVKTEFTATYGGKLFEVSHIIGGKL